MKMLALSFFPSPPSLFSLSSTENELADFSASSRYPFQTLCYFLSPLFQRYRMLLKGSNTSWQCFLFWSNWILVQCFRCESANSVCQVFVSGRDGRMVEHRCCRLLWPCSRGKSLQFSFWHWWALFIEGLSSLPYFFTLRGVKGSRFTFSIASYWSQELGLISVLTTYTIFPFSAIPAFSSISLPEPSQLISPTQSPYHYCIPRWLKASFSRFLNTETTSLFSSSNFFLFFFVFN